MNPTTLHEMTYVYATLRAIKKPNAQIKAAIAKLESHICTTVAGLAFIGPIQPK